MSWYLQAIKKYAVFSGRAQRKEFWTFAVVNFVFSVILGFSAHPIPTYFLLHLGGFLGAILDTIISIFLMLDIFGRGALDAGIIEYVFFFGIMPPSLAVAARRMHDTGRSGWWIFVPIVGLLFCCFDSQVGTNKYGQNPKGVEDENSRKPLPISLIAGMAFIGILSVLWLQDEVRLWYGETKVIDAMFNSLPVTVSRPLYLAGPILYASPAMALTPATALIATHIAELDPNYKGDQSISEAYQAISNRQVAKFEAQRVSSIAAQQATSAPAVTSSGIIGVRGN